MTTTTTLMRTELASELYISGKKLEKPVMNGAGPVKLPEDVLEVARSSAAAIIVGSITIEPRTGNIGKTYFSGPHDHFSLNSRGLPNPGLSYYKDNLPKMVQIAHDYNKPLIVSIAGFLPEEYARLAHAVLKSGVDGLEMNMGCPNVWGEDGKQKRITSFNPDLIGETLHKVEKEIGRDAWIAEKLSPFSDPYNLQEVARVISGSKIVNAVVSTNTFPNAFYYSKGKSAIDPGEGLSGMAGSALKPIGLGQVMQLRNALPEHIAVIGVGGIKNRADVLDYLRAGASAVQITTAYINVGPSIFTRTQREE